MSHKGEPQCSSGSGAPLEVISLEYVTNVKQEVFYDNIGMEIDIAAEDEEDDDETNTEEDRKLLLKYLEGEMPFSAYAAMLQKQQPDSDGETPQPGLLKDPLGQPVGAQETKIDYKSNTDSSTPKVKRKRTGSKDGERKGGRGKYKMDPVLKGLIGEANLCYVRGEGDKAIKLCNEVIRENPFIAEPFQTLGMIYEERGEREKSLQYQLLAVHLKPPDPEEWMRLADISLELGKSEQAKFCLLKAYNHDRENMELMKTCAQMLEQSGETSKLMNHYKKALRSLVKPEHLDNYFSVAETLSRVYYDKEMTAKAIEVLQTAFEIHPTAAKPEALNLLLELMMGNGKYLESLQMMDEFSGVSIEPCVGPHIERVATYSLLPVDLHTKLIICLVHIDKHTIIEPLIETLHSYDPNQTGDLYLDVADVFFQKKLYNNAVQLLQYLVQNNENCQPAIWWELAKMQHAAGHLPDAVTSYRKLLEIRPQHSEGRRKLSEALEQLGLSDDALIVLKEQADEPLDLALLYHKCQLLKANEKYDEFITTANLIIGRHFPKVESRSELDQLINFGRGASKTAEALDSTEFTETELQLSEESEIFKDLFEILYRRREFVELEKMAFLALASKRFGSIPKVLKLDKAVVQKEFYFMGALAAFYNKDYAAAFNVMREFVSRYPKVNKVLNVFNLMLVGTEDTRFTRFVMRLLGRHNNNLGLLILNGNCSLYSGTYKFSLNDYMTAFRMEPTNPLLALLVGIIYIHLASQKFLSNKHNLVLQGLALLNTYLQLRGEGQEAYYNLGRAMHQIGIVHTAIYYYKKALQFTPVTGDERFDLTRQIAYNMAQIYKDSGSPQLARMYLYRYIHI